MIPFLDLKKINNKNIVEIQEAVNTVITSGHYLLGNELNEFEKSFAAYCGTKHCIGVSNGLDALNLILKGYMEMGMFKEEDEIIVPANTFIASILPISRNLLNPVLVEPNIDTYNITPEKIEAAITTKTKAVIIVHLYGRCAYNEQIQTICDRYNLKLIEDNAQAQGAKFMDRRTGSLGNVAATSFYPSKNLGALGDAGAITTSDPKLAKVIRSLSNYGSSTKNLFHYQGFNSRLDELQAAVLRVKLKYLDDDNEKRRSIAGVYLNIIKNRKVILPKNGDKEGNVWHLFVIRNNNRDELMKYLLERGVETSIHYPIAPHKQKAYSNLAHLNLPITEKIHAEVLSLPISPVMSIEDAKQICDLINSY